MMIADILKGSRVFHLFWICVFLGSCSYIQTIDNRTMVFSFELASDDVQTLCGNFKRSVRLSHVRPNLPKVDISRLSPDEINDLLLAHTEKVKAYMDHEEQYLLEDINRHNQKCAEPTGNVFQK